MVAISELKVGQLYEMCSYNHREIDLHVITRVVDINSTNNTIRFTDVIDFKVPGACTSWLRTLDLDWKVTFKPVKNLDVYKI